MKTAIEKMLEKLARRKGREIASLPARVDGVSVTHFLVRKEICKDTFSSVIYETEQEAHAYLETLDDKEEGGIKL